MESDKEQGMSLADVSKSTYLRRDNSRANEDKCTCPNVGASDIAYLTSFSSISSSIRDSVFPELEL